MKRSVILCVSARSLGDESLTFLVVLHSLSDFPRAAVLCVPLQGDRLKPWKAAR